MLRSQGSEPLLNKRQRKGQSQIQQSQMQSQLDPFSQLKAEGGGAGPLPAPRRPASHGPPPPPVRVVGAYSTVDEGSVERKDELLRGLESA